MKSTKIEDIPGIINNAKNTFLSNRTKSVEWRITQLKSIEKFLTIEKNGIIECLKKDLAQSDFIAEVGEITTIKKEVKYALNNINDWIKRKYLKKLPISVFPASVYIVKEPLGVSVIFGVWNFPFITVLNPLISSISAGNCVIIKPSEISTHSSNFIAEILPNYIDNNAIKIITGGIPISQEILTHRVDHILFTGNPMIGKIVMAAAAKNLTPVTLELGGKNPVFVCPSTDFQTAAKRIIFGKITNVGQACVAPDYVLIDHNYVDVFCQHLIDTLELFYGERSFWKNNSDISRIINQRHFNRLISLLNKEKGQIIIGGKHDSSENYIEPTIIVSDETSPFMKDEIFGPILIIIPTKSIDHSLNICKTFEKPLSLYIFSKKKSIQNLILDNISSGTVMINGTLLQASFITLPFGGVGHSGFGKIHGEWGFNTFSNERSVVCQSSRNYSNLMYPPYDKSTQSIAKYSSFWNLPTMYPISRYMIFSGIGCLTAIGVVWWIL